MQNKFNNVAVVILAGGKSERAEMPKGLRVIEKQLWIDILIKHFEYLGFDNIFVGLGFDSKKYLSKSVLLQTANYYINPNPKNGSFSTLQNVLKETIAFDWKHIVVMHIDHAKPNPVTLEKLIVEKDFNVVKPLFNKQSGHPIVLSHTFCRTLLSKPTTSKLNVELKKLNKKQIMWVNVEDASIHENMNLEKQWLTYSSI